jgi:uncharacterized protein (TIGR02996 family)
MKELAENRLPENAPLLRAIHLSPDDNPLRLVYADWLEEQGDKACAARAELIRVQVELARPSPANKSKRRRARLQARQQELLAAYEKDWLGPWADTPCRWVFVRGMPERIGAVAEGRILDNPDLQARVEFHRDGRVRIPYGGPGWRVSDFAWAPIPPWVSGSYRLRFTFAEVQVEIDLWDTDEGDLEFTGRFIRPGHRVAMELGESRPTRKREARRGILFLSVPGKEPPE